MPKVRKLTEEEVKPVPKRQKKAIQKEEKKKQIVEVEVSSQESSSNAQMKETTSTEEDVEDILLQVEQGTLKRKRKPGKSGKAPIDFGKRILQMLDEA